MPSTFGTYLRGAFGRSTLALKKFCIQLALGDDLWAALLGTLP